MSIMKQKGLRDLVAFSLLIIFITSLTLTSGCFDSDSDDTVVNQAPVAVAGTDQDVKLNVEQSRLTALRVLILRTTH